MQPNPRISLIIFYFCHVLLWPSSGYFYFRFLIFEFYCIRSRTNDSGKRCMQHNIDVWHSKLMYPGRNWFMLLIYFLICIHVRNFVRKKNSIQMFVNRKMRIQKYIFTKSVRWFSRHSWPLFKDRQEKCLSLKRTTDLWVVQSCSTIIASATTLD